MWQTALVELPSGALVESTKFCQTLDCYVQDTVSILRGISDKYSSYHGVRIADRALVVAAELADRYITNRFLPDKAIDLVDEACSNMRVQLDSMPEEMDKMQRQQYRLQVEEAALSKEKDPVSHPCHVYPQYVVTAFVVKHRISAQHKL